MESLSPRTVPGEISVNYFGHVVVSGEALKILVAACQRKGAAPLVNASIELCPSYCTFHVLYPRVNSASKSAITSRIYM